LILNNSLNNSPENKNSNLDSSVLILKDSFNLDLREENYLSLDLEI